MCNVMFTWIRVVNDKPDVILVDESTTVKLG